MQLKCEVNYSAPSSAEVINAWSFTYAPVTQYCCEAQRHRNDFTFILINLINSSWHRFVFLYGSSVLAPYRTTTTLNILLQLHISCISLSWQQPMLAVCCQWVFLVWLLNMVAGLWYSTSLGQLLWCGSYPGYCSPTTRHIIIPEYHHRKRGTSSQSLQYIRTRYIYWFGVGIASNTVKTFYKPDICWNRLMQIFIHLAQHKVAWKMMEPVRTHEQDMHFVVCEREVVTFLMSANVQ